MRKIDTAVIHCSASHQNVNAAEIKRWHIEERGWSDIGYHFVILPDGTIELGRPIERIGAHVSGHNKSSIGICWVGGYNGIDNRTDAQKLALRNVINTLVSIYNISDKNILGHRDFKGVTKSCPNFDVQKWYFNE